MANPGKTYNLPCSFRTEYAMGGEYLVFVEKVKVGGRDFQVNVYPIEVE